MMAHYKGVLGSADTDAIGLATIQHQDKVAAKLLFEDPGFIDTKYKSCTLDIKEGFQTMRKKLCQESSIPPSVTPSRFAKGAVDLKQWLHPEAHFAKQLPIACLNREEGTLQAVFRMTFGCSTSTSLSVWQSAHMAMETRCIPKRQCR